MKQLPSMEHEFSINVVGSETQKVFAGSFGYKRPNLGVRRQIKTTEARLNEDVNLDEEVKALNTMLSWLQFTLTSYPTDWWKGGWDMYDFNVILEIWENIMEFEKQFQDKLIKIGEEDETKSSDE